MRSRATLHAAATFGRRAMLLAIAACALAALLHPPARHPVAARDADHDQPNLTITSK